MTVTRTWAPIESDARWEDEGYYDSVSARCDGLAKWWSQLCTEAEHQQFSRQWAAEEGGYDGDDYPRASWFDLGEEDPEYIAEVAAIEEAQAEQTRRRREAEEMQRAQFEFIEASLQDLGARMARPYEHWNEDEALMAYMERDR